MSTIALMGRNSSQSSRSSDRHKKRKMVAIRQQFIEPAERVMERLGIDDMTELANIAMRTLLEIHQEWPLKPKKDGS